MKLIIMIILSLLLSGCASSSDLSARAKNNEKAGRYYESIGQPQAAQREYELAAQHAKQSEEGETILFDILWGLFTGK